MGTTWNPVKDHWWSLDHWLRTTAMVSLSMSHGKTFILFNYKLQGTRAIYCDSVGTRWAVPIALKIACHTVEMCVNCKIPSSNKKKHIKRNKRSSRRLMGDQVASIRRWGPREHAKPTPLFFTPTGSKWLAMEIWCRTPAIALVVVYANNDRGNNNNNNN